MKQLPSVRRIVTGTNASGHSYIAEDGRSPAEVTMETRPGFCNSNLWRTLGADVSVDAPDSITQHRGVLPPQGGTVLRVIDIPPESNDLEELRKQTAAVFAEMYPDATRHDHALERHPGMHITDTVDYAILLQGELVAIMDEGETVMRAGDILIQRGTNHAWANRSGQIARIAFILVDGRR
ncbi:MAG TPA: cupin domain-containing protein [Povalibacter sp.]|uniref:cupin domain-containing protein n=1 Tax=Povalibacter sp. TaxID=1962978 RepID=UPI002C0B0FD6|nr:cupin domain-containing protein [Povalibacter sp.]HMN43970.1 cupin domain-containing protein [Povalibacter sp.]